MTYNYIFPTCVFSDIQEELAKSILPVCEDYFNKYSEVFQNNENHRSTYRNVDINDDILKNIKMKPFIDYVIEESFNFLKYQNVNIKTLEKRIRNTQFFLINKINKGGSHCRHSHPGSIVSGCFYLKCSENSSPLMFTDPREYYRHIHYDHTEIKNDNPPSLYPEFFVPVKQGTILIWPSWLEHEVPHSTDSDERISIAFNIG
jgi:hypothetical protein